MIFANKTLAYRDYGNSMRVFLGYTKIKTSWISIIILCLYTLLFCILILRSDKVPTDPQTLAREPVLAQILSSTEGVVSAYTLSEDETDGDPCMGAYGVDLCKAQKANINIVANNCLEKGTPVKIENKIYIVLDRMNSRYNCNHYDIVMKTKQEALQFGRKKLQITNLIN